MSNENWGAEDWRQPIAAEGEEALKAWKQNRTVKAAEAAP